MRNERLRALLLERGQTPDKLAEAVGVDAKTVERWITKGRTPYRSHRYAVRSERTAASAPARARANPRQACRSRGRRRQDRGAVDHQGPHPVPFAQVRGEIGTNGCERSCSSAGNPPTSLPKPWASTPRPWSGGSPRAAPRTVRTGTR